MIKIRFSFIRTLCVVMLCVVWVATACAVDVSDFVEEFNGVGSINGVNGWEEQMLGPGGSGTLNGAGQYVMTDPDNSAGNGAMLLKRTLGKGDMTATLTLDDVPYLDTSQFVMKIVDADSAGGTNGAEFKISVCCSFNNTAPPVVKVNHWNNGAFTTVTNPGGNSAWPAGVGVDNGTVSVQWTDLPGLGGQWDFSWNLLLDNSSVIADSFSIPQVPEYNTVDASPNRRLEFIWEVFHTTTGQSGIAELDRFEIAVPTILPGDFTENGFADGDDLDIWEANYGLTGSATHMQGDANEDLNVSGADFLFWQRDFTGPALLAASIAVPEPSSCILALMTAIYLGHVRRQLRADIQSNGSIVC